MIAQGFKPGDVVRYRRRDTGQMRAGIVTDCPRIHSEYVAEENVWAYWTNDCAPYAWPLAPTHTSSPVELHPDPDPILTSWTAWRLTENI
jgi:hypothetical protein